MSNVCCRRSGFAAIQWIGAGAYVQHAATVLPYDVNRSFMESLGVSDDELLRRLTASATQPPQREP